MIPLQKLGAIYVGGMLGALLRVGLAEVFPHDAGTWPWPTLVVNLTGAFLIGYFYAAFRDHDSSRLHHPLFATGLCGTLTTFSAMQLELFEMVDTGAMGLACAYLATTLVLGYLALKTGIAAENSRPKTNA